MTINVFKCQKIFLNKLKKYIRLLKMLLIILKCLQMSRIIFHNAPKCLQMSSNVNKILKEN